MKTTIFIFLVIICSLTSCEGFVRIQGHVFDSNTKDPLDNVEVLLILRGKDTVRSNRLEYDTVPYEERMSLREQGVKDDYNYHDPRGLSRFKPSQTDSIGQFQIGNMLVGCVPRCPTCKVVFLKDGYKPLTIETKGIVEDSVKVYLEKID